MASAAMRRYRTPGVVDGSLVLPGGAGEALAQLDAVDPHLRPAVVAAFVMPGRRAGEACRNAHRTQGIDQQPDGAVPHALRTGYRPHARALRQIGREKPHGGSRCHNIKIGAITLKSPHHDAGVVTVGKIAYGHRTPRERVQNQRPVANAFRRREQNPAVDAAGREKSESHFYYILVANTQK